MFFGFADAISDLSIVTSSPARVELWACNARSRDFCPLNSSVETTVHTFPEITNEHPRFMVCRNYHGPLIVYSDQPILQVNVRLMLLCSELKNLVQAPIPKNTVADLLQKLSLE